MFDGAKINHFFESDKLFFFTIYKHNNEYKIDFNMKKRIRLTESDLHRIINESVKRIINETINEYPYSPYPKDSEKDRQWCENTYLPTTVAYWKAKHPEWSEEQCRKAVKKYAKK